MDNVTGSEALNETETDIKDSSPAADPVDGHTDSDSNDTLHGTVESTQTVESDQTTAAQSDLSFNVASIFVLSMLVGLVIFHILSRRWQT